MDSDNMHFVVTGAASGIGAATCRLLAAQGARITMLDLSDAELPGARFIRFDQGDPASIEAAAAAIEAPVHALCNVAGLPPRPDQAERVLRVNFLGLRHFTRAMLPRLADGAAIVNVASRAGAQWREHVEQVKALLALEDSDALADFVRTEGIDDTRAYNLSKEAVIAWSMAQCEPLIARGLRINTISPGAVATPILGDFLTAFGAPVARNLARVGRSTRAEEVAEAIAFLCSPASGWIKGVDLVIDGGIAAVLASDALGLTGSR